MKYKINYIASGDLPSGKLYEQSRYVEILYIISEK